MSLHKPGIGAFAIALAVVSSACTAPRFSNRSADSFVVDGLHYPIITARADDVSSIDGILDALYDTLDGAAGDRRDWSRIHTLYHPQAAWHLHVGRGPDGSPSFRNLTFGEYASGSQRHYENSAFYERSVKRQIERFGNIAHAWVTCEWFESLDPSAPVKLGTDSIQLYWDGSRWWTLSIMWELLH